MKKFGLFFTFFLFFAALSAEEVQTEASENAEVAPEAAETTDVSRETIEKPKFFYIQPALGTEFGSMMFGAVVNLDIDFLVAETKRKNNIYLGVDLGAVFAPEHFWGIPLQANITFDFKQKDPRLNYVSLWISLGANFCFEIWRDSSERYVAVAWRTGLSIVFVNNMVIKIGLDRVPREKDVHNLRGLYLSLMIALGYRF